MKLLVAADGSGRMRGVAFPAIVKLADEAVPEVIVLHVVRAATESWSDEELEQVMAERRQRMDAFLSEPDFPVKLLVEALPYGEDLDHYIAMRAADLEVDAIVVSSRRATGMVSAFLGSVAQGLLRTSPVPVIVVRPGEHYDDDTDDDDVDELLAR